MPRPRFKMYQDVILISDSLRDDFFGEPVIVRTGQIGQIMLICTVPDVPSVGYVVEFFDDRGETIALSTVKEEDIAPLPDGRPDIKVVKPRKHKSKSKAA